MPQATVKPMDYAALGIKVEALEGDVREVKDSILGLDAKIEKSISSLSHEVRAAISALSSQFAERNRTPWGVLFSGAAVVITVLGLFGSQALSPMQADIKSLKDAIVPRPEIEFRYGVNNQRLTQIEGDFRELQRRRYDEFVKQIERLEGEIRSLRTK